MPPLPVMICGLVMILGFHSALALAACSSPPLTQRFVRQGPYIKDLTNAILWQRCPIGSPWHSQQGCRGHAEHHTLHHAHQLAQQKGTGWRLPTIDELFSLVDPSCGQPAINTQIFPQTRAGEEAFFWSNSPVEEIPGLVYAIHFKQGDVDGHTPDFPLAVRLVRDIP
ncbi:Lcl C-terminal domain-containing protein [Magnetococcus sp. PR-3]|uniref:Lcl C-terminal domain-containing protein n=1 Tax=Magnetococcus sp. PR-3 TaxID=3120355 RepID=UPI002FCDF04F